MNPIPPAPKPRTDTDPDAKARSDARLENLRKESPGPILRSRRFDHACPPAPLRPVYTLAGKVIGTPGNLVAIASAVKTGKSAVVAAMLAATMGTDGQSDLLGFASENPKGLAVVHIDSEQSPFDHWHCVDRAVKRAGLRQAPPWLYSFCFSGLSSEKAMMCLREVVNKCGGIHSVLLDGIADLVKDPNDAAECNDFIAELFQMAIDHECPLVGVIHFNPGSDKTRGHLGSQFERKAETNLRLDKDADGVTEIWSEKQRRAPIPKGTGPCFQWSDEAGMHVTVENPAEAKAEARADAKLGAEREAARVIFAQGENSLSHSRFVELLHDCEQLTASGAKRRIQNWFKRQVVRKNEAGLYELNA